ncbi:hypothetical protein RHABOEDO_000502 [Candidatus Rhabdochlamydia oedothoracis]|uniref:Uncharacterized protein n=1 Tax=Candidatus Rhabdochlamydia oedothoracis TaxID=2720720 RepID=A0ABX8V457_9BACT|nr:hypothetical protein [Candidatus Rhabdochlamydia oedothoracis]QYF48357.1 hypothetical protein RHABOEDO_000502 [Candidatus Rhabdochlamydia oedothoracis]
MKIGNGFTDPKYGNIPRSKRIHARHKRYKVIATTTEVSSKFLRSLVTDRDNCRKENQVCNSSLKEKESTIAQLEEQCSRSTRYKKSSEKPTTIFELTQSTTAPETTVKQTKPTAATSTAIPEPTTTTEPKITKSTNIQRGIALIGLALFATGSLLAGIFMFKKKRRCQHSLRLANNLKTSQRQGHTQLQGQCMKISLDN